MQAIQQKIEGFKSPKMKVLTLWQPWATLLVYGIKKIETRPKPTSWTAQKGTYLIHAAQKWSKEQAEICLHEPFKSELIKLGFLHEYHNENFGYKGYSFSFPMGAIIGSVEVEKCCTIYASDHELQKYPWIYLTGFLEGKSIHIHNPELDYGNYESGRSAWICKNPRLINPIPYKGGQGYYQNFKGDINQIEYL